MGIVAFILVAAISPNVDRQQSLHTTLRDRFPFIGAAVWLAILVCDAVAQAATGACCPKRSRAAIFLLSLVLCASLMPVEKLPAASWQTAFGLGFVSAVFDNIPLTALALKQGGYDWGMLAYAVGFGGSMIWFGSSAGVALSNMFPEAQIRGPLAAPRLACRAGLCDRLLRDAGGDGLAADAQRRGGVPIVPAGDAAPVQSYRADYLL